MNHLSKYTLFLHLFLSYVVAVNQDLQAIKHWALYTSRSLTSHSATLLMFFIAAMSMHVTTSFESIIKRSFKATTTRPETALEKSGTIEPTGIVKKIPAPPDDTLAQHIIELASLQNLTKTVKYMLTTEVAHTH
jgi:hypothetical protein